MQMRAKVDAGELTRAEAEAMIQGSLEPARMQAWANTPSGNWPTPTCSDAFTDKLKSDQQSEGSMHSVNLSQAVKMWPTPQASDNRDRGNMSDPSIQRRITIGKQIGLTTAVKETQGGGSLNPDWVEWLMGWPVGWTDLKPLETDRFRMWPHSHGIPSTPASNKDAEAA